MSRKLSRWPRGRSRRELRVAAFVLVGWSAIGCSGAPAVESVSPPPDAGRRLVAEHAAVTSASPLASEAGVEVLRAGGNAVDAAVATAFAIGVVEPQMSGLGGGGAMLIWLEAEGRAEYLDFYAAQDAASFVGARDTTRRADLRIVGIPGDVAGLLLAHERYGRLSRAAVMAPAIRLAEEGFPVNQILSQMIARDSAKLHRFDDARAMFWPEGRPLRPGTVLRNPRLAGTLRAIAEGGADAFYRGGIAREIVALLNRHGHPSTVADFAEYEPRWKRPLCTVYRGHVVLSAPPPQTGSQVLHTLELLEPHDLPALGLPTRSATAFDVLASALRVGMADNRANGDPRWGRVPANGIISEAFARQRAPLVGNASPPERVEPADATDFDDAPAPPACAAYDPYRGEAAAAEARDSGPPAEIPDDAVPVGGETTHLSVVDAEGNAVALTQTNSSLFGSGAHVAGFFLNDSGFRFDGSSPSVGGSAAWRTRTSTIAPTMVLDGGRVRMVTGAPGGGRIPTAITQTMVYTLDYGMDPLAAVRMPRMFPTPSSRQVELENGFAADVLRDVRAMGWDPAPLSFGYARLYSIVRSGNRWIAVADPRHDGEPRGW